MLNAIHFYRLARFFYRAHIPLAPRIVQTIIFLLYNSCIPYSAEIGPGSFFAYGGIGVVLHKKTRIGANVVIGQHVTVGGRSGKAGVPRIGSNCYVGPGSAILGDIDVGDFVVIGVNAVVIESIPSHSVAAGVPARIVRTGISEEEFHRIT